MRTCRNGETKRAKRARIADEILGLYSSGMRTKRVLWSDETWVDRDTCARFNPQNERKYYSKGTKKDAVLEDLRKPVRQRTPGIMVHISVTAAGGGAMLKPHFVDPKKKMTADYYTSMLKTDVFPQAAALFPEDEVFYFQQDLASSHTAKATMAYLRNKGVRLAPWLPSGADLSPLDIFVNPELKRRLRGKDMSTHEKVMGSAARALSEMSEDPEFKASLKKCCRGIKKRTQWVAAHGGRIATSSLVKSWAGPHEQ